MELIGEPLPGVLEFALPPRDDDRGRFVKTHAASVLARHGVAFDLREEFHSVSRAGVVRGMHFQRPPHDHDKLVYCVRGRVEDVVLDLRRASPTYGRSASVLLDADRPSLLVIPRGFAHGFAALCDDATMVYKTSSEHAPDSDAGVRWDSFGHAWRVTSPTLSPRDQTHPALADFVSPF